MLFEELIPAIESKPEIWNELFNNPSASDKAWEEIAQKFDCEVATIKKRWEDLKFQYRKELEEDALTGEKSHEVRGGGRSHEDSSDATSEKDSGEGRSAGVGSDQDPCEQRFIGNAGSKLEDSSKVTSDEDPSCRAHRLTKEGLNAMHFIRDQIILPGYPSGKDNQPEDPPQKYSEALRCLQLETLQTPESSHILELQILQTPESSHTLQPQTPLSPPLTNETEKLKNSSTGYLIPIPLKHLGALEGGHEEFMRFRSELERSMNEEIDRMGPSVQALADALQYVGSDSDDYDDWYGLC